MGSVTLLILVGSSVGHPGCHLHDRSSRRGSGGYETGGGRHGHGSSETDGEGTWTLQEGSLGVLYVEGVEKGCGGHETGRGRSIGRPVRERGVRKLRSGCTLRKRVGKAVRRAAGIQRHHRGRSLCEKR